jgi:hypothetical protein
MVSVLSMIKKINVRAKTKKEYVLLLEWMRSVCSCVVKAAMTDLCYAPTRMYDIHTHHSQCCWVEIRYDRYRIISQFVCGTAEARRVL